MSAETGRCHRRLLAYAGKTLILYNDAPAAYPARVPQYDYYTGAPDRTRHGGAPTTSRDMVPTPGPSCRSRSTIVTPAAPYNLVTR